MFDHIRSAVDRLVRMFFTGVRLDRDKQHTDLWVWTIDRAMRVWKVPVGPYYEWWRDVQHYPPMLLLQAGFMGALLAEHEDVVLALATQPKWRNPITLRDPAPAFEVLDPRRIDANTVNSFPRWEGKRLELPQAHLLGEELRPVAMDAAGGPEDYMMLVSDAQYRLALAMQALPGGLGGPFLGLYVYEEGRRFETIPAEERFRASGDAVAWGWADTSDGSEFDQALLAIREYFERSGVGW